MTRAGVVLLMILLFQTAWEPCVAKTLKKTETNTHDLKIGAYVVVTYVTLRKEATTASGFVLANDKETLVIGKGLWRVHIPYSDVMEMDVYASDQASQIPIDIAKIPLNTKIRITQKGHQYRTGQKNHRSRATPSESSEGSALVARRWLIGDIVAHQAEAIIIKSETGTALWQIPYDTIARLEASYGKRSRAMRGAIWGTLSGSLMGAAIGWLSSGSNPNPPVQDPTNPYSLEGFMYFNFNLAPIGALIGAPIGFVMGAIIGSQIKSNQDAWTRISLPVNVSFSPQHQGRYTLFASVVF